MDEEEWRDVPSVPTLQASSWGRVKADPYEYTQPNGGTRTYTKAPSYGYKVQNGNSAQYTRRIFRHRSKTYKIATVVCEAFHGPRPEGMVVSHLDEDSDNNRADNLTWMTQKENMNMPSLKKWHSFVCRQKMLAA